MELEGLLARRASVSAEFDNLVPENDPFREPLSKVGVLGGVLRCLNIHEQLLAAQSFGGEQAPPPSP